MNIKKRLMIWFFIKFGKRIEDKIYIGHGDYIHVYSYRLCDWVLEESDIDLFRAGKK